MAANLAGIVVAAVASICTNALYGPLLSSYSAVPSVQQYCTSKYPVATVTTTSTAPTVTASTTSIENVPAATVTSTSTSTVVSTAPTVTTTTFAPTVTVTTVATTTTESVSTQTAYTCPATPNRLKARGNTPYPKSLCPGATTYRTQGGDTYGICQNFDSFGGDLQTISGVGSANACADACSRRGSKCVAAVYKKQLKKCWLKSRIGNVSKCNGATFIYKMPKLAPSVTTTRASSTTTSKSSTTTSKSSTTTREPSTTTSSRSSTSATTSSRSTSSATSTTSTTTPFQPDATFCSCIATTPTSTIISTPTTTLTITSQSTITPAITVFTTSLTTTTTTPTSTSTSTPTTISTVSIFTSTTTVTSTTTSTTSIYPTNGPGPREVGRQDTCNCSYTVRCGVKLPPSIPPDDFESVRVPEVCRNQCDQRTNCITAVAFTRADGILICNYYYSAGYDTSTGAGLVQDRTAKTFTKVQASCGDLGAQCCKSDTIALLRAGCFDS
ncbi:unnamed protein product [Cercospora beticola]|nr:unnamed protein product [Cercospora beticola]